VSPDLPRTLFIARGRGSVAWYRCALPALALGCDWIGVDGAPPDGTLVTGAVPADFTWDDVASYDVVVLQLADGPAWLRAVRRWQAAGVRVLYEVDDWLRGVRKQADHALRDRYDRKAVEAYELVMRVADGLVCSTPWLAERYRLFNDTTFVCRNGIDLKRYALARPESPYVGIGWAGGTGHAEAVRPWLGAVAAAMATRPATRFVTIGEPFADEIAGAVGAERALAIPFGALESYPAAMTHFDVALAPAGTSSYFRGKSDLRWLEAGALGIPAIADPAVYPDIEHGVTGFHAHSPEEAGALLEQLLDDPALRRRVGQAARAYVTEHRCAEVAAGAWAQTLRAVHHGALQEVA
jgi:glycosyltransferase involved in cell wall biosynthesis